ncbi:Short-chain dehydrogenase TIC 32, chloroplastic [Gracilariopsis chorda]|uniref:Short-chain dehydrogenase TIC 32, chloroplastic n=1 Tax=Gracilariopsis chorda TaxID=448386 RepID=A0A2V3IRV4_9FLOR|nr:Short-chain dehydrogenase TIC 32, chloroplastic [Gracilariopsis chorda]|eukprot:PXF44832.1 Short-chain dehydrogenase TIC 32, chloroplastic [Gracilariopsis chorda]
MSAANPARTAVITGASGGIGAATARSLVSTLPTLEHLILAARDINKAESVAEPLRKGASARPVKVTVVPVELSDLISVRECAEKISHRLGGEPLDLLINNAGIMACPLMYSSMRGENGYVELQYATNHLSHAALTTWLLSEMEKSDCARAIFVSSLAVRFASGRTTAPVVEERVEGVLKNGGYEKWRMYGESKLAMSMFARELSRRSNVFCLSLHPGVVQTELIRYVVPKFMQGSPTSFAGKLLEGASRRVLGLKTPEQGAELSIELSQKGREELENGMMYMKTGLEKLQLRQLPIFWNNKECSRLYEDTVRFVTSV